MHHEINIYQDKHKDEIINMILNIQIDEFGVAITRKDQPDLEMIPEFYQKGTGNFWVATKDNHVIGSIALIDIGNNQTALRKMFVAKEYRGKERNVAKSLLDTLITWCESKDVQEIYLGTVAKYFAAHRFYEKNGFIEIQKQTLPDSFPLLSVDSKFYSYIV